MRLGRAHDPQRRCTSDTANADDQQQHRPNSSRPRRSADGSRLESRAVAVTRAGKPASRCRAAQCTPAAAPIPHADSDPAFQADHAPVAYHRHSQLAIQAAALAAGRWSAGAPAHGAGRSDSDRRHGPASDRPDPAAPAGTGRTADCASLRHRAPASHATHASAARRQRDPARCRRALTARLQPSEFEAFVTAASHEFRPRHPPLRRRTLMTPVEPGDARRRLQPAGAAGLPDRARRRDPAHALGLGRRRPAPGGRPLAGASPCRASARSWWPACAMPTCRPPSASASRRSSGTSSSACRSASCAACACSSPASSPSPGAYSVSSLSTVVQALLRAGGPSAAGSFRNIELRRGGNAWPRSTSTTSCSRATAAPTAWCRPTT